MTNCLIFHFFTFLSYYLIISFIFYHFKANEIKASLLKPARAEAELGDIPNEFAINDVGSDKFIIKHTINCVK